MFHNFWLNTKAFDKILFFFKSRNIGLHLKNKVNHSYTFLYIWQYETQKFVTQCILHMKRDINMFFFSIEIFLSYSRGPRYLPLKRVYFLWITRQVASQPEQQAIYKIQFSRITLQQPVCGLVARLCSLFLTEYWEAPQEDVTPSFCSHDNWQQQLKIPQYDHSGYY